MQTQDPKNVEKEGKNLTSKGAVPKADTVQKVPVQNAEEAYKSGTPTESTNDDIVSTEINKKE